MPDILSDLDIEEQIARIKRTIRASDKFYDGAAKLRAERSKFDREHTAVWLTSGAAILAAGAAIGGVIVKYF